GNHSTGLVPARTAGQPDSPAEPTWPPRALAARSASPHRGDDTPVLFTPMLVLREAAAQPKGASRRIGLRAIRALAKEARACSACESALVRKAGSLAARPLDRKPGRTDYPVRRCSHG